MSIKCGNKRHQQETYHETVAEVRACFAVPRERTTPKGREIPETFGGTPKQYDLLIDLCAQRGLADYAAHEVPMIEAVGAASNEISRIMALPRPEREYEEDSSGEFVLKPPRRQVVTGQVTEDGIYRNRETGELFKVQFAVHGSGALYAKQAFVETVNGEVYNIPLVTKEDGAARRDTRVEWTYKPGLLSKIKPEWKMTLEEAQAFGALYGRCFRCGRTLTREDSIARMMGSTCANKEGW